MRIVAMNRQQNVPRMLWPRRRAQALVIRGRTTASIEFLLERGDRFEDDVADNGEAVGADFVHGVFSRVPIGIAAQLDDIDARDAALKKRLVIVDDSAHLVGD